MMESVKGDGSSTNSRYDTFFRRYISGIPGMDIMLFWRYGMGTLLASRGMFGSCTHFGGEEVMCVPPWKALGLSLYSWKQALKL